MHKYTHRCVYTYAHTHAPHTRAHTHAHAHTYTYTHTRHIHISTHSHRFIHLQTHAKGDTAKQYRRCILSLLLENIITICWNNHLHTPRNRTACVTHTFIYTHSQVKTSMLALGVCERIKRLARAHPIDVVRSPILQVCACPHVCALTHTHTEAQVHAHPGVQPAARLRA